MRAFWNRIANHPVGSNVVASAIIALAVYVWSLVSKKTFLTFWYLILKGLSMQITFPMWLIILGGGGGWMLLNLIRYIKGNSQIDSEIWEERVGDYTFLELFNILDKEHAQERTERMKQDRVGPSNDSLLQLFRFHRDDFNGGVKNTDRGFNDGGYLADVVAPKLYQYKLLEKEEYQGFEINYRVFYITYLTSEAGFKFFNCLDRLYDSNGRSIYR
jgi:hypothetical protein